MFFRRKKNKHLKKQIRLKNQKKRIDYLLLIAVVLISLFGLLMIFDASVVSALRDFGSKYHFVRDQGIWLLLGVTLMMIVSFIDYHRWYVMADLFFFGILILLIGVFIPGVGIRALGASRWINFRFFILQPAELTKLALIIYLPSLLANKKKKHFFLSFFIPVIVVIILVILEPDLGTAMIILSISTILYFLSGAPLWHLALIFPFTIIGGVVLAITSPYRLQRVMTFFNPNIDPLGSSYHIRQILLALGSGGLFGLGIGKSRQKYEYLPEASTDSIFAVIGEEFGFFGAVIFIGIFLFIIYRTFSIAKKAPDQFGRLLASGIGSWVAIQTIINLSAMVALLPLTGVPLPFISYGGSNLVVTLIAIGILLNISKQQNA